MMRRLSLLVIVPTIIHAAIPYVDPQPGENIWRITSRIGTATDYILDNMATTTSDSECCFTLSSTLEDIYELEQEINNTVNNIYALDQSMSTTLESLYILDQDTNVIVNNIYALDQSISTTLENLYILDQDTNSIVNNIYTLEQSMSTTLDNLYILDQNTNVIVNNIYTLEQSMSTTLDNLYDLSSDCCVCTAFLSQANLPITITQPGIYCLTENVSGSATLITIASSNVTVDLRGHTLSTSSGNGVVINAGKEQVTVRNGSISAFAGVGVSLVSTGTQIAIQDIFAYQCDIGFNVGSNCATVQFINCTAQGSDIYGFSEAPSSGSHLHYYERCSATGSGGNGFNLGYAGPLTANNCLSSKNGSNGFGFSTTNILKINNCSALQNNQSGFSLNAVSDATILQCTAAQNGSSLTESIGSGFYILNSDATTCMSCIALDNYACGFSCQDGTPVQFFNNFAKSNTSNGGVNYNILGTSGIIAPSSEVFANYVVSWWTNVDGDN